MTDPRPATPLLDRIASPADLKGLSVLVNDVLLPHESVARVRSSIVLDRLKASGSLPLGRRG